ncbi:protein SRG1-like [Eucalyptus grandis]|uniref:protein SRG1-like n=1 Tax=Eucalyptus grandis TaxID=71139 RepID=UPI00192EB40D|nr:protein SRG1-like [Eucalyptus grandis]
MVNVQLMNHGVLDEGMRMMKENVQGFFDLPHHEKQKSTQKPGSLEGYGQAFVTSHDQKLQWNNMIFLKCHPAHARNLDLWPKNPPEFRIALEKYNEDMRKLAAEVVKYIGMALGIHEGELDLLTKSFGEGKYEVRMNYYPACPSLERTTAGSRFHPFPRHRREFRSNHGGLQQCHVQSAGSQISGEQREGEGVHSNLLLSQPVSSGRTFSQLSQPPDSPIYQNPLELGEFLQCFLSHKLDDAVPFIDTLKL